MIRGLCNAAFMLSTTMVFAAIGLPVVLVARVRGIFALGRVWSWLVVNVCGVRIHTEGFEAIDTSRAYVVMANHTSHFDVISLYRTIPMPLRFVAKKELTYVPIFGWVLTLGAAIVIDRKNRQRAIASVERARRAVERGESVLFFPEGTRSMPGELGPLKKGGFHLATDLGAPILPIGIEGTGDVMPRDSHLVRPGSVVLRAGKPIESSGFTADDAGRAELLKVVEHALKGLMEPVSG